MHADAVLYMQTLQVKACAHMLAKWVQLAFFSNEERGGCAPLYGCERTFDCASRLSVSNEGHLAARVDSRSLLVSE